MKKENMSPPAETWLGSSALSQSVIAPDPEDQEKNTSLNKDRSHFLSKKIIGRSRIKRSCSSLRSNGCFRNARRTDD